MEKTIKGVCNCINDDEVVVAYVKFEADNTEALQNSFDRCIKLVQQEGVLWDRYEVAIIQLPNNQEFGGVKLTLQGRNNAEDIGVLENYIHIMGSGIKFLSQEDSSSRNTKYKLGQQTDIIVALKEEGYYEQSAKESCLGEACDCCERMYKG